MSCVKVDQQPISWWTECTEKVVSLQGTMTATLSFLWMGRDLPEIVRLLPTGFKVLEPAAAWVATNFKPFEIIASIAKQIGTIVDLPDRWKAVRVEQLKGKPILHCLSIIGCTTFCTIDGLLLIPNYWNWINLGQWSSLVGTTPFYIERVKEGITIVTSLFRVIAGYYDTRACNERIAYLNNKIALIKKGEYQPKDKSEKVTALNSEIATLEKELAESRQKLEPLQKSSKIADQLFKRQQKKARIESLQAGENRETIMEFKIKKAEIKILNEENQKKIISSGCRYETAKMIVLIFNNLIQLSVAVFLAPTLGLSVATVAAIFFVGRWALSLATGSFCIEKIVQWIRYQNPTPMPETYLKV